MSQIDFKILGDNPVELADDKLNFKSYVEYFADRLIGSADQTPFTVGISAPWGQGKTTFMQMLQKLLSYKNCTTIWFDPWKYHSREGIWKGLCYAIVTKIQTEDHLMEEIRRKNEGLKKFFASFLFSKILGNTWGQKLLKSIEKEPWEPSRLHEFESTLNILFEIVLKRIGKKTSGPVVLFVDDLDRCLPKPAVAVLEALKLVLNKKGLITIVGIAESELHHAIIAAYAKELQPHTTGLDENYGETYLRKIIQMPTRVPDISIESFESYVSYCLATSNVIQSIGEDQEWCSIIRELSESNLRQVKRFINSFISEMDKADANTKATKNKDDMTRDGSRVAFILLLASGFPDFFRYIRSNSNDKNLFLRYQRYFTGKDSQNTTAGNLNKEGKKFLEDEELQKLFARCLEPKPQKVEPLVDPFSEWEEFFPYLQFGSLDGGDPPENGHREDSEPKAGTAEKDIHKMKKRKPKTEEKLSIECTKVLDEAQSLISGRNLGEAANILNNELRRARRKSDRSCESALLTKLANIHQLKGENILAVTQINEALRIGKELQSRQSQIGLLIMLSQILRSDGQLPEAVENAREAKNLAKSSNDPLSEITAIEELGLAYEAQNDFQNALKAYDQLVKVSNNIEHLPGEIIACIKISDILLQNDDIDAANTALEKARVLAEKAGDKKLKSDILGRLASIDEIKKDYNDATDKREKELQLRTKLPDQIEEVKSQVKLVHNYEIIGKTDKAQILFDEAKTRIKNLNATDRLTAELEKSGDEYSRRREYKLALKSYESAKKLYKDMNREDKLADLERKITDLAAKMDND